MEIHVKLIEIRSEIEIYENPACREILLKRQLNLELSNKNRKQQIWVISDADTPDNYILFLQKIKTCYPTEKLIFSTSLAARLEAANSKDVFLLSESQHTIYSTGALEAGGILRGIGEQQKITVTSSIEDVMLDFITGDVLIENVTIDAKSAQCGILVRKGTGVLKNCKIIGDGRSSTHQGIIVLEGAEIRMIDCDIDGFHTAIVGNSGSSIVIENCNIHNSVTGIKLFDNCIAKMTKVDVHDCYNYGIFLETQKQSDGHRQVGSFDLFEG